MSAPSGPMADPENLLPSYDKEHRDDYWLKRWEHGDKCCQWKVPERRNGDAQLLRHILQGLNIVDQFPKYATNTKSVTESDVFFQKYSKGANVAVPLCGDSRVVSLLWEAGFNVTGFDLSDKALKNIVAELGGDEHINWTILEKADCEKIGCTAAFIGVNKNAARGNKLFLYAGDCFKIELPTTDAASKFDIIFDRGSLVALLPEMRQQYCDKLRASIKSGKDDAAVIHPTLFSSVQTAENKKVASLWLFKRAVHNEKTIKEGPPFHFDIEQDVKGTYFKAEFGFEKIEFPEEPTKEQVEHAPNGAFVEIMTNIYRM